MTPYEFAAKWGQANLSESAGSQEHFIDICRLVGQATPAEADPNGDFFTFEKSLKKESGRPGFADVWRKSCFAWEYKGQHADLGKAYAQLQLYREALGNPPLLVVCDFDRYEVHTNFNNTVKRIYRFSNADSAPSEAEWPSTDVIIGNPPFLGRKLIRRELGDDYVDAMFEVWADRVPREADLCCYWFEKARSRIEQGFTHRAGLLATQGIRGGRNREVLDRIAECGAIFWAQSDREWTLDGAAVHVSMVGFSLRSAL